MIVTPVEMRAIEDATFAAGVSAESLMDEVGRRIAARCLDYISIQAGTVVIYAGKGNNAGDALVAARELYVQRPAGRGPSLRVLIRLAGAADDLGPLPGKKLAELPEADFPRLAGVADLPRVRWRHKLVIVDGLLGIGASGPLREPLRSAAREINYLRQTAGAYVLAIDTPSGLDTDNGEAAEDAVVADETLTVGFVKTGLLEDKAANYSGCLRVIELAEFGPYVAQVPAAVNRGAPITPVSLAGLLPPRAHESNKGMYGRVGILAGSVGATGAAVMCAHACARAGAGLITLLTHPDIYPIVAAAAAPEVMVKPLSSPVDALEMGFDVLALGPGLGKSSAEEVCQLVERWPKPMIIDADGLNILAEGNLQPLLGAAGPRLLTPHPGEMQRLRKGDAAARKVVVDEHASRAEIVRQFTDTYPVTLLLKGARTVVGEKGRVLAYNTTGNAGLATGGTGDTLTGVCAALAGQKLSLYDAARLGAWLHGRAADFAVRQHQSEQSLLATDLPVYFGAAFKELRACRRGSLHFEPA